MEYVGLVALIVAAYAAYMVSQKPDTQGSKKAVYSKKESDAQIAKLSKEFGQDIEHIRGRAYELQERVHKLES